MRTALPARSVSKRNPHHSPISRVTYCRECNRSYSASREAHPGNGPSAGIPELADGARDARRVLVSRVGKWHSGFKGYQLWASNQTGCSSSIYSRVQLGALPHGLSSLSYSCRVRCPHLNIFIASVPPETDKRKRTKENNCATRTKNKMRRTQKGEESLLLCYTLTH